MANDTECSVYNVCNKCLKQNGSFRRELFLKKALCLALLSLDTPAPVTMDN